MPRPYMVVPGALWTRVATARIGWAIGEARAKMRARGKGVPKWAATAEILHAATALQPAAAAAA